MGTAVLKKESRTGLHTQGGVQDQEQVDRVANGTESGEKNLSESGRDHFVASLADDKTMYLFVRADMENAAMVRIRVTKGIDPQRFADLCQKLSKVSPNLFDLIEQRFEDYVF